MHQSTTPSLSQTIWVRWASRQFLSLPIVQSLLPVTFGYSLSSEAVIMRKLRRWKRLWRRSLIRSSNVVYYVYTDIHGNIINCNDDFNNKWTHFFIKIYLSHFILQRVMLVVCERWAGDRDWLLFWPKFFSP